MNTPVTMSLMSIALGMAAGVVAFRVSRARGWRELRWFAVIAFLSAGYAAAHLSSTLAAPPRLVLWASHLQLAVGLVQYWAWMRYAEAFAHLAPTPARRWPEWLVLSVAALALVPGIAFRETLGHHTFAPWGVTYADGRFTALGYALLVACTPVVVTVFARFASARRQGIRLAGAQAAAFAAFLALSLNDAVAATGRVSLPYLLDIGLLLPVGIIAWAASLRFLETAEDLDRLRGRLESLVEERTRALAQTQERLVRAERLASLGQLANGVAHQVSNPASVVTANLRYLAENLSGDSEAREVVADAMAAMQRINDLVRRLADAGRIAVASQASAEVDLCEVVARAVAEARPRLPAHVTLDAEVPPGLNVRTRPEVLEQVLQSLLANAADALPPERPGRIEIRAERRAGGIRLTVSDDGVGMLPQILERAFEPFFTTKPAGQGSGLGLPISRGIVEVHGGALWLESTPERGTTAVLVLPETAAA